MAFDFDQYDNDGDSDVVDSDPIAAISVPGIPTAVLVPVTGEVLCPVVPSFIKTNNDPTNHIYFILCPNTKQSMTNTTIKDFSWKTLFRGEMLNILSAKYDHLYDFN